jgi:hypothetical protein
MTLPPRQIPLRLESEATANSPAESPGRGPATTNFIGILMGGELVASELHELFEDSLDAYWNLSCDEWAATQEVLPAFRAGRVVNRSGLDLDEDTSEIESLARGLSLLVFCDLVEVRVASLRQQVRLLRSAVGPGNPNVAEEIELADGCPLNPRACPKEG